MIYLASRSPRRLALLEQIGITDVRLLLDEDEARAEALEAVRPKESPTQYVERVARAKGEAAWARLVALRDTAGQAGTTDAWPLAPLLAADTTVAVGGKILGKPEDADDAARILGLLSGRSHRVLSSVVVIGPSGKLRQCTQMSRVRFRRLTDDDIAGYIASGEPFGKAGAYGIQGLAACFVRRIEGSYSGIMGLPLFETAQLLGKVGVPPVRVDGSRA
jgi:septum formation protein maf